MGRATAAAEPIPVTTMATPITAAINNGAAAGNIITNNQQNQHQ
jgi:hypothetical protein